MIEQPPSQAALSSFATDASVGRDLALRDAGQRVDADRDPARAAISIEHIADHGRRYPGEIVSFHTRVNIHAPTTGFEVRIQIPSGVEIDTYRSSNVGQMPLFYTYMEDAPR